ncbi:MAG: glycosyltransferase, partial [Candidatus Diapherotrites archaeon]|nr:glycosyltransferase [Candidatus Diapherotrites archaeon]
MPPEIRPPLSVFLPARNEETTIQRNLQVLLEGLRRKEINHAVVVLDGSTDRTPEIVFRQTGLTRQQINALTGKKTRNP